MSLSDEFADAVKDVPAQEPEPSLSSQFAASLNAQATHFTSHSQQSEPPPKLDPATNAAAGFGNAAANIGSTLLWPVDKALYAVAPKTFMSPAERRQSISDFYEQSADPRTAAFQAGKIGGSIAGTAGVGPALGVAAKALGAAPAVSTALGSGGMSVGEGTGSVAGNAALRAGAGATVGATTAGALNPESAATGGLVGALTPGAAWLLGAAGGGLRGLVGGAAKATLGATTGTGSSAVEAAYNAGKNGDSSFLDNMRGNANIGDIVEQAKDALSTMRAARGQAYRSGMAQVSGDKTVLDIGPVQDAVKAAQDRFASYHGEVVNENASAAIQKVAGKVNDWATKDPTIFRTPEGLDKLKQWVGGELENAKPGTQTDAALKGIYNSIKSTISAQAPMYAKTMADYETASEQLTEISRSLSLGQKASADTAIRKLQSVLRNNVNTNFGNRASAVSALEQQGGASLVPALAGQSMNSWWPRGVAGAIDAVAAVPAGLHNPALLAGGIAASPRLVGEAAYKAGTVARGIRAVTPDFIPANAVLPALSAQQPMNLSDLMRQRTYFPYQRP